MPNFLYFSPQKEHGWRKSIVERLSKDLLKTFPGTRGFSTRNLWNMRQFYLEHANPAKLQPLAAVIPWGQNTYSLRPYSLALKKF